MTRRLSPEEIEYIVENAVDNINHFCWHVSGDPAVECLWSHVDRDLELLQAYLDKEAYELLEEADDESLSEVERRIARELEFVAADAQKEVCKEFDPEFEERIPYYCQAFF
mgnify:CR=1 FL=1